MGLTVHYHLRSNAISPRAARALVEKLHRRARSLSFDRVDPIETFKGDDFAGFPDRLVRWLDAIEMLLRGQDCYDVLPTHGFAFMVYPGRGCESAAFGLALYPKTIVLANGRRARTRLSGWSWRSFCKTQYASNPRCGGFENFRRCHLSLVALLDSAVKLGLHPHVTDESGYATHRDLDRLRLEIGEWNELVAGFAGRLKDELGGEFDAPITRFPNFEHLEARGRKNSP